MNGFMRRWLLICLSCCLGLAVACQKRSLLIRLTQDDSVYELDNNPMSIIMKKKNFKMQVYMQSLRGVFIFASFRDSIYNLADSGPVPGFADLPDLIMKEEDLNKEKELFVSDRGWCYWCYNKSEGSKGFNRKLIILDSNRVMGIKSIKQVYLPELRKTIKLKDINQPLYLFFVAVQDFDDHGKPLKEFVRRKVKIDWVEDD
jgi:hypothetical protein